MKPFTDKAALRHAAEARLKKQNQTGSTQSEEDVRWLHHELEIHQIELEMQNDELRRAQMEINLGLESYTELFDFSPAGYFNLTADGTIRMANHTGAGLLGIGRAHLLGKQLGPLVAEGDRNTFNEFLTRAFIGSENETCRVQLATDGQPPLFVRLDAKRSTEDDICRVTMLDVTKRKQAEEALLKIKRALQTVTDCNRILVRATSELEMLQEICRVIAEQGGYRMVWIGFPGADEKKSLSVAAHAGFEAGYLNIAKINWREDDVRGQGPSGIAFRTGEIVVCNDFQTDPTTGLWQAEAQARGYASSISLPLKYAKECFGVMMIYASQTDAFQDKERQLLAGLADDLSFAMDALRTSQRHAEAMASLAASEVRFRKLFYDHSAIKVITDADTGKIVDANAAAERFYGWSVEQLKRMTISQVNMLDEEGLKTAIGKTKKGEQNEYEFKHRLADGSVRDVTVFINPMNMEGKTLFYCIIQDITERKQAEADLLESGRLVSDVLNSLGSLMVVLDERGNIMAVNGAWQSFAAENGGDQSKLGVGANYLEVCKMSLTENVDETASAVLHGIQAVLDGTKPALFLEYPCHSPTSKRWFAMKVRPFSGNRKGAVIEHENITERKLAEAKARESEMRFTIMADAVPVLIWEAGTDMLCCYFNQPWLDFTGRTLAQETGNGWSEGVHPDDLAHCMEIYTRSFNARQEFQMEYRLRRRDGEYRWLLDHGTPRFQADGAFAGYIGSCVDITEHKRAEEKQRVLSQRLELATHAGGVGIWDWDIVNNDLIWDDTICEIYGVPHGGFTGGVMEWSEHLHPDDRSRVGDDLQAAQRGEREYASEFRIIWPDGSIHHIKANSQTFFDENGKPLRMVGTNIDITERKQAVAELAASEKRHRAIIDSSPVPQAVNDEQQNITYLNQAFVSAFGYTQEDIPTLADWWPKAYPDPEYRKIITETWKARLAKAKQTGNAFEPLEVEVCCKDGNIKTILATVSSLSEGNYEGEHLAVLYDITERKLIEESHARLAAAVEQAAESIVITDPVGTIIYVNPMFETSTGYTRVEAIGQNPRILKGGKQNAGFYQKMWTVLQRGEVWQGHLINKRKDGSLYEEEAIISPIRTTVGKITSFVAVKRDVTREVELENQLRHSQKMKAIGTLAGGVAHDFNNILAAIQMQAEILDSSGGLSDDQADLTREMLVSVKRAADLTRQLLLFSRKQVMQPDHLDLNESVTSMTKILTRVLGENIEVRLKLAEQPLPADADAGMLDQVLMNLAINARDAMSGNGQLVIETVGVEFDESTAAQTSQARPGKFVCLSVSDTGCGISPENLPRIFEPFFTTKDVGKGTGLGLATAFGIVQQHKGWINVYSEVGQGTTFRVYLPQLAETHDAKIIKELSPPARTGSETILLVEDESTLLGLMRMILTQLGYRVLEAPTGVKAMEVWLEHSTDIHLLLTDLFMPDGLNGKELAHRLLAEKPNLKVVYMSGYSADIIDKDFALKEGENFLAKPFDPKNLARIIRDNLDKPTPLKPIKRPQRRKS